MLKVISWKDVTAVKPHICVSCAKAINPGELYMRIAVEFSEGRYRNMPRYGNVAVHRCCESFLDAIDKDAHESLIQHFRYLSLSKWKIDYGFLEASELLDFRAFLELYPVGKTHRVITDKNLFVRPVEAHKDYPLILCKVFDTETWKDTEKWYSYVELQSLADVLVEHE